MDDNVHFVHVSRCQFSPTTLDQDLVMSGWVKLYLSSQDQRRPHNSVLIAVLLPLTLVIGHYDYVTEKQC